MRRGPAIVRIAVTGALLFATGIGGGVGAIAEVTSRAEDGGAGAGAGGAAGAAGDVVTGRDGSGGGVAGDGREKAGIGVDAIGVDAIGAVTAGRGATGAGGVGAGAEGNGAIALPSRRPPASARSWVRHPSEHA